MLRPWNDGIAYSAKVALATSAESFGYDGWIGIME